tara:strand:+ start:5664 stop:5858 length:195 start_codon:yes stop_codon:yes gene_type:complete
MMQHISLIIKAIKNAWNNHKSSKSINQERYDLKRSQKIPEDKVQNCCKLNCACKKKKKYLKKKD